MANKNAPKGKLTDAERHQRFVDMAHEVGASEDPQEFERAFKKVVISKDSVSHRKKTKAKTDRSGQ